MLRDSFIALQELAKSQREQQQDDPVDSSSDSSMAVDTGRIMKDRSGPVESIRPRDFEQVGGILHPFWYSPQHGRGNIRLAKNEVKRWERSIAFLDNEDVPEISDSTVIENVLEIACGMLKVKNMGSIRVAVSSLFEPLSNWSASVIRTRDEHYNLHYAIARALVRITRVMVEAGFSDLTQTQQDYVKKCYEIAKAYIVHADNQALLGEDDFSDEYDDSEESVGGGEVASASPVRKFHHLLRNKCPVDLFVTDQKLDRK